MGEKDEKKDDGEKKAVATDAGGKKAVEPITAVLKLDLHCEGCAKKVRRSIRHFEGVEKVKADYDANKLTVIGNVDPSWLRDRVESKTKKKVELVFPQPKKEAPVAASGGDKKTEEKSEPKKADDDKKPDEKKPKEPVASTIVMKIRLHCDGCANKIKRTVLKNIDGVQSAMTDLEKDLVTITGTMDVKDLISYLKQKVKRNVDIIPPKKDDGGGDKKAKEGGEKQEKGGEVKKDKESSGGGEKKQDEAKAVAKGDANKGKEEMKVEVINKMEQHSVNPHTFYANMPIYNQNYINQDYGLPMYHHHQDYASTSTGYMAQYQQGAPPPPPTYVNINDQMFSDENPNGCFVM